MRTTRKSVIRCQYADREREMYNPQIQKSAQPDTKGSKSAENRAKSQFQRVIELQITQHHKTLKRASETA